MSNSKPLRAMWAVLGIVGACAACCALPLVGMIGLGGLGALGTASVAMPELRFLFAALTIVLIAGAIMVYARHRARRATCKSSCAPDRSCCGR